MLDLLFKRRSIRRFKEDKVPTAELNKLLQAALLSPSSRGIRPWEFIVVDDKEVLADLARSKEHGSSFLNGAPLGIVVIADQTKTDVWIEDTAIASIIIQLMAESLGLGSCWIQIRNRMHHEQETAEDYIRNLLNIPDRYRIESVIALGYPDEEKLPYTEDSLKTDKIHFNRYLS